MKTQVKQILVLAIALSAGLGYAQVAHADCPGCTEMQTMRDKLNKFTNDKDDKAVKSILEETSKTIQAVPRDKKDMLSTLQVRALVDLLRASEKHDKYQLVIEENDNLIRANKSEITSELKKIPPAEAKQIAQDIFLVLNEEDNGDDGAAAPAPKPSVSSPAKKNK